MDIFQSLNKEGITVVMITHDHKVASFASRIVYILDGKLYSKEEYEALELGGEG